MLRGGDDDGFYEVSLCVQRVYNWGHFNGLGTRPHDDRNAETFECRRLHFFLHTFLNMTDDEWRIRNVYARLIGSLWRTYDQYFHMPPDGAVRFFGNATQGLLADQGSSTT